MTWFGVFFVNFKHSSQIFFGVCIAEFEQVNVDWLSESKRRIGTLSIQIALKNGIFQDIFIKNLRIRDIRRSCVFIVYFKRISHVFTVFVWLNFSKELVEQILPRKF